jgi:exodeoxyribonuclease VII small subunit
MSIEGFSMSPKAKSKTKTTQAVDALTFEQAFKELEDIVRQLEDGQLPLDDSLALYERGQALAARCGKLLDTADLKIETLAPAGADDETEDLDESGV